MTKSGLFVTEGFSFNGHHPSTLLSTVDPCQKVDRLGALAKNLRKTGQSSALKTLLVQILAGPLALVYHAKYRISMLLPSLKASRASRRMMMYHHSGFHGFRHHHLYFSLGGLRRNSEL